MKKACDFTVEASPSSVPTLSAGSGLSSCCSRSQASAEGWVPAGHSKWPWEASAGVLKGTVPVKRKKSRPPRAQ